MRPVRSISGLARPCARTLAATALALLALLALASAALAKKEVFIVSHTKVGAGYYATIQSAVEVSKKGDWILVEPGEYNEEVKVTKKHGGIFIRGMNRNTVVVNGEGIVKPEGANGIEIYKADDVWVENLTVKNFERASLNGAGGNEIWWNGGAESEKIGAHGWYGKYLTAYDTGLNGGYGIFTSNEETGEWENIYASGFNDSGIYIGACPECKAVVNKATMEYNALGYSGSNSGGQLIIEHSTFAHNTTGIAPNSENPGDGPPPQNGACKHSAPLHHHKGKLPSFKSTEIKRCTIIRENLITENNDLAAPANTSAAKAPWGAGIELPGDYGDLVEKNKITKNPSDGVLAFEYPNPYPPTSETIYFQNAGNEVKENEFEENGTLGKYPGFEGDVAFEGGVFGTKTSTNNCLIGNKFKDPTFPLEIQNEWGCQNKTTPNPGSDELKFINYLVALQEESEHRPETKAVGAPPEQEKMANPCENVPGVDALCENGKPL
jgi:hypothetical protein